MTALINACQLDCTFGCHVRELESVALADCFRRVGGEEGEQSLRIIFAQPPQNAAAVAKA